MVAYALCAASDLLKLRRVVMLEQHPARPLEPARISQALDGETGAD